ncbi:TPA: 4Fe-4S ferredoxin [Candidatus Gastranaerophilales bacterium HUM_20]|nr:ferredoxin [Clostridium sp. CAG:729]DAB22083.1 MAG TPA: 4Fe-4S ferredoxin [Candidatus Gastranaerophilales bacterium HUM_20]
MLKELLEAGKCFKLVCGAGNEDALEVEKLVALYSKAGCKFFDVSAKPEIIDAAKKGLQDREGYICVSVGIKGDPHVRKAQIDYEKCAGCHKCEEICPQKTIKHCKVKTARCIGCGKCYSVCTHGAISFLSENKDLNEVLPPLIEKGIDCIEFHVMGEDESGIYEKWDYINSVYDGLLSICTARGKLSEEKMISRIERMTAIRKPYTTIVQADGFPMSGGKDDYKTTLQAVATAEIVQNAKMPVYIMLSGGTNSKTAELAKLCGINYNGIAIGTFARKIVNRYIEREDFLKNDYIFNEALNIARSLVGNV